ncbi:MAG: NADH-quinone oxidoreductase subunit [Gaiellales bacterium]|nr:NADH-quinone oxidoreductase subunit [Gaiellales bacterium]
MIGTAAEVAARFAAALGPVLGATEEVLAEDVAGTPGVVVPAGRWHDALAFARDGLGLDFFDWLSAVDQTDAEAPGFDVVAHLVRAPVSAEEPADPGPVDPGPVDPGPVDAGPVEPGPVEPGPVAGVDRPAGLDRVLVRTRVPDGTALASVTDLWPGAAWHERETFEMFGVAFDGFEDGTGLGLRPLLLPEGFEGTPMRKSFVLAARASKPWPGAKEPGESDAHGTGSPSRRKLLPPGVPDANWGPRPPAASDLSGRAGAPPTGEPDNSPSGAGDE